MNNNALFSSRTDEWETPLDLFNSLNNEFHFTLDVCANSSNYKCSRYYDPSLNGLLQKWDGIVWCNPPYGRSISEWVRKAYYSSIKNGCIVVMLLPARTDTSWFHDYILGHAEIRFIRGRLKFGGSNNNAPFPSMVVVYK